MGGRHGRIPRISGRASGYCDSPGSLRDSGGWRALKSRLAHLDSLEGATSAALCHREDRRERMGERKFSSQARLSRASPPRRASIRVDGAVEGISTQLLTTYRHLLGKHGSQGVNRMGYENLEPGHGLLGTRRHRTAAKPLPLLLCPPDGKETEGAVRLPFGGPFCAHFPCGKAFVAFQVEEA